MHRATLLLACACAIYAHQHYPSSRLKWPAPEPQVSLPVPPPTGPPDYLSQYPSDPEGWPGSYHSKDPKNSFILPYQNMGNSEEYVEPDVLPRAPKPWAAPSYYKSLQDFDEAIVKIKSYIPRSYENKNNKQFRYLLLLHVVSQLAQEVTYNGGQSYNRNYVSLVKRAIEDAYADPKATALNIDCSKLKPARKIVEKARYIIDHPAVEFVCTAQPSSCDAVIWVLFNTNPSALIKEAAQALLTFGSAANTFLRSFADTFDAVSEQNIYKYLLSAKEHLRPLVFLDAQAYKTIISHGEPKCNNEHYRPNIYNNIQEVGGSPTPLDE